MSALMLRKGISRSEAYRHLIDDGIGRSGYRSEAVRFAAGTIGELAKTLTLQLGNRPGSPTANLVEEIVRQADKIKSLA